MKPKNSSDNPRTVNEHFDRKYGVPGSKIRNEFEQKTEAFMVAELVKDSRKKAHMTQEQLAKKLNVNRAYISKIERASSDVRISTLRRIIETGLGGKLHINVDL